uniref:zinc-binding protein A33-like n=1 Tax=Pristiophorus japonicus TaxID=55135 RepID=UPI00398EE03E
MATAQQSESWTEEAICPICLDFFTDPVILECGHNFCRSCITQNWAKRKTNSCPECREEFPEINLKVNRALVNLAEKARKLAVNRKDEDNKLRCEEHQEELTLFCETDKKLICVKCLVATVGPGHKTHNFMGLTEAAQMYRDKLRPFLESATKRKDSALDTARRQKQQISGVREQASCLQTHITSEFAKMHQILTEKEQRLIRDLREQEGKILKPMEKNLSGIQQELDCAEREISKLQRRMANQNNAKFLKEEVPRVSKNNALCSLVSGELSLGIFKGPLQYTVWKEMRSSIIPAPASLTLDPKTKNQWLILSEDRTRVRLGNNLLLILAVILLRDQRQLLSGTPESFNSSAFVLGSEGFTTGRHYWQVVVEDRSGWSVGVVKESVNRTKRIVTRPAAGYWAVGRETGGNYVAFTSPSPTPLSPSVTPRKIGVYLDYEGGQVSFYNADNMSHLYTFTHTFTERIFPIFDLGSSQFGDNSASLTICSD